MSITDEEASSIKEHLMSQLENFPEDKRAQIKEQINSMTNEQVEAFVQQNNLTHLGGQCIFCSIVAGKTPSFKIAENNENIAILEINPLSKGHTLIIPIDHAEEITDSTRNFAKEIGRRLEDRLKPQGVKINELKIMDHALLEVVPIYGDETQRKKATEDELRKVQEEIKKLKEVKIEEKPRTKNEDIPVLPMRIP